MMRINRILLVLSLLLLASPILEAVCSEREVTGSMEAAPITLDLAKGPMQAVTGPAIDLPDSLFAGAGSLYEQGKYSEALIAYEKVLGLGSESADLYYNMGNAAYRSNQVARAILYYEKALKLEPSHDDARNNLDFVSRYRLDTFEELPVFFLASWKKAFLGLLSERSWSLLALALFILILGMVLLFLFAGSVRVRRLSFSTAAGLLLLFILSFAAARSRYHEVLDAGRAIVMTPSVIVRSSPSETGNELFILHEGTRVDSREALGEWRNIRIPDGREGWLPEADIAAI